MKTRKWPIIPWNLNMILKYFYYLSGSGTACYIYILMKDFLGYNLELSVAISNYDFFVY